MDYPRGAGSTAIGLSLDNETLREQAETLLRTIGYSGICDLDWRRDARDGQYKLLDCNPRIGLNFQMFQNAAGIDVVRALHLDLNGRKIQHSPMIEGRLFVAEQLYLRSFLRGGRLSAIATERPTPKLTITRKLHAGHRRSVAIFCDGSPYHLWSNRASLYSNYQGLPSNRKAGRCQ